MMTVNSRTAGAIGLILAGPLLIALHIAFIAAGAPDVILIPLAVVAWWLVGPALVVVGVAKLFSRGRWPVAPSTVPGKVSLRLWVLFPVFILVFVIALSLNVGPDSPDTFFENLYLAIPVVLAGASAIASAAFAGYAIAIRHERSLAAIASFVAGFLVLIFVQGELGGHDEGGSSDGPGPSPSPSAIAPLSNSHSNVSVANLAPGVVQVSFDYAYLNDPPGATIATITVTPLGNDRKPIGGYEPAVRPINRGTGHVDATLTFSEAQLAQLDGFSICFTSSSGDDFGCAMADYKPQ